jgi:hypothetical protein
MKLMKVLDQEGTNLLSDTTNQTILRELVTSERSVSELAAQLNLPTLKLWRRIQKLLKANMVELTRTQKVGNLEKKLYRATATWFAPQQYFTFTPKDPRLKDAFKIYSEIQKEMMTKMSILGDVPKDDDPVDFSLFASMHVFAEVCGRADTHARIVELRKKLAGFYQY